MKKRSAKIKLAIIGFFTIMGLLITFLSFPAGDSDFIGSFRGITLGLDLRGGICAVYEAKDSEDTQDIDSRMDRTVSQLSSLLDSRGYGDAVVVREGVSGVRIEVADNDDTTKTEQAKYVLSTFGDPAAFTLKLEKSEDVFETIVTGEHIKNAIPAQDSASKQFVVHVQFDSAGTSLLSKATAENSGKNVRAEITREGATPIVMNETIKGAINNGVYSISGSFSTFEDAVRLADQIMSGSFPVALKMVGTPSELSPVLGDDALLSMLIGGIVAFVLILALMCVFYRVLGGAAALSMVIYMVLLFFVLCMLPWVQLSLAGIAAIVLSFIVTAGGLAIIFERIKEEFRDGKSILASYYAGFKRAKAAVLDSGVVLFIVAIMFLIFGTGAVRGFGLTLAVGLVLSIFTTLVITRFTLKWVLALDSTNRDLYNLKRKKDFDESKEVQYVEKVKATKEERVEGIRLVDGVMPEGADDND